MTDDRGQSEKSALFCQRSVVSFCPANELLVSANKVNRGQRNFSNNSLIAILILLWINLSNGSACLQTEAYNVNLQPAGRVELQNRTRAVFYCSINVPNTYPTWKINDIVYDSTNLPPGFIATGSTFSFPFESEARVQCFFQMYVKGEVVDVCSDTTVLTGSIHG
jgi:hypothetical protein